MSEPHFAMPAQSILHGANQLQSFQLKAMQLFLATPLKQRCWLDGSVIFVTTEETVPTTRFVEIAGDTNEGRMTDREQFEAWFNREYAAGTHDEREWAFEGWQAARAAPASGIAIPAIGEAPEAGAIAMAAPAQPKCDDKWEQIVREAYAEEAPAHQAKTAKQRYDELGCDADDPDPLERLRFFCSLAMTGQDWLDVEEFFDAVIAERAAPAQHDHSNGAPLTADCDNWCRMNHDQFTRSLERTLQQAAPAQQLEECRLYAARHRKEEWAQTILRFCGEAGVTGSPLRAAPAQPAEDPRMMSNPMIHAIYKITEIISK
jgi:hypothetical protein